MKLALEAKPSGVVVVAECDLKMSGCTALSPAPVTVVNVGQMQDQFVVCRSCLETMIRDGEWDIRHARIAPKPDFLLIDKRDNPLVAVEARMLPRSRSVKVEQWATALRRNLAAHGAIQNVPYFLMLVLPTIGFLWTNADSYGSDVADYRFPLSELNPTGGEIPEELGSPAEEWTTGVLLALIGGDLDPTGLWWTESGLGRLLQNEDGLSLVHRERSHG